MSKPKEPKEPPTLDELKDAAIRKIGSDGVVIVNADGVRAVDLKTGRKKVKPPKTSNREPPRAIAPKELADGYRAAANLAEARRNACDEDSYEYKAWNKIVTYCEMMAICRFVDEPEGKVNYLPWDERIVDKRVLGTILDEEVPDWTQYQDMAMQAALAMLGEKERITILMYYGAQMRREDIAEMLETTPTAVRFQIERARKKWAKLRRNPKNTS